MIRRSFFNPFSALVLALAVLASVADTVGFEHVDRSALTPAVLFGTWLIGGLVRCLYERHAARRFERHMQASGLGRAWVRSSEGWTLVDARELAVGDVIRLSEGERCPVDALVSDGEGLCISESAITGEAGSEPRSVGQALRAGSVVVAGSGRAQVIRQASPSDGFVAKADRLRSGFDSGARQTCLVFVRFMVAIIPVVFAVRGAAMGDWGQAALFSLAVVVGLVPEMLPVVTSACLSVAAARLERGRAIVKDVNALETLGRMDEVCVDKTGTLTDDRAILEYYCDVVGNESPKVLSLSYVSAAAVSSGASQLDRALVRACESPASPIATSLEAVRRLSVVETAPFDRALRTSGVTVRIGPEDVARLGLAACDEGPLALTVLKGEVEAVCARCARFEFKGRVVPMDEGCARQAIEAAEEMRSEGIKVLAVAYALAGPGAEPDLALCGFLGFFDAPKASAKGMVASLSSLGVRTRVLTGDSASVARSVCARIGIPAERVLTGEDIDALGDRELVEETARAFVFAELTPLHKARLVQALQRGGSVVGYLGDGSNDLPALRAADLGMVVESAAGECKEAADVVMTERGLESVVLGVREGRRAFANASKYVRIAASSNFGNICSVAVASLFLPFLPATASQLLALNVAYDLTCLTLPWDRVDEEETRSPRSWSETGLAGFMALFGPVSALFDALTFALLFFAICPYLCGGPYDSLGVQEQARFVSTFQAGWLLECVWTQSVALLALRGRRCMDRSGRPGIALSVGIAVVMALSAVLLSSGFASMPAFGALPAWYVVVVACVAACYGTVAVMVKRAYLKRRTRLN